MYISFSLIQLGREKYLDKNCIKPKLFERLINIYGIKFNDYQKCYQEIKEYLEKKDIKNEKEETEQKIVDQFEIKILDSEENLISNNNDKKKSKIESKFKTSRELPFVNIGQNNLKNEENGNNDDKKKDENIIIYDESNNVDLDYNLNLNANKETKKDALNKTYNKMNSLKEFNHMSINCNTFESKSNENLPKINPISSQDLNQVNKKKSKNIEHFFINCKSSSSKNIKENSFRNSSNSSSKNKKLSNSIDYKRGSQNFTNNSNDNISKTKKEMNSVKKSLFSNNIKPIDKNQPIVINKNFKKMISEPPKSINLNKLIKEDINDNIKEKENNFINNISKEDKNLIKRNKSKTKYKNNLIGKETKIYVKGKRNLSNDYRKRKFKSFTDVNNIKTKNNGLK